MHFYMHSYLHKNFILVKVGVTLRDPIYPSIYKPGGRIYMEGQSQL
jgi:hypothetical protein